MATEQDHEAKYETVAFSSNDRATGRRVVALVHSKQNGVSDTAEMIDSFAYHVTDVVVRKTLIAELDAMLPDVVVVDDSLADFETTRVCHDIRQSLGSRVLVLVGDDRVADENWTVRLIEAGADDVVPKSTSPALLRTRLLALMRLAPGRRPSNDVVVGDICVDVDGLSVFIAGRLVRFPKLQFDLLLALARRQNKVASFEQLLTEVWNLEPLPTNPRRVRVAMSLLRKLVGEGVHRPRLETVQGVGYRLVVPRPSPGHSGPLAAPPLPEGAA